MILLLNKDKNKCILEKKFSEKNKVIWVSGILKAM